MALIKGHLGNIYLATGTSSTFTKEAMTANVAKTVFTIDDATKRFWDPTATTTVYYNDIANATYASIQYPGGVVTWTVTPGNEAVTVSGKYFTVAELGEARSWSMDVSWEMVDVSTFGDTFRVNTPIFRGATVSMEHFYVDDSMFTVMSGGTLVGFDLFMDETGGSEVRYTGLGYMASQSISTPVDGIIDEPLSITVTHGPYYVAGLA